MFEDLIPDAKKPTKTITDHEQCPNCNSTDVSNVSGQFVPSGYVETIICNKCRSTWHITYDQDLNIVNIQHGS